MLRITKLFSFLFLASMATVATVDAQTPCATNDCGCAQTQGGAGGCTANLSDCGRSGALFGRRQQNCNDCGDCGDCGAGGCAPTGIAGGYADSGSLMDRVKDFILPSDGCGGRYRSVFGGWSDLSDYSGNTAGAGVSDGTFRDGFILGTARGRYLNCNTRLEFETAWRNNSGEWDNLVPNLQLDGHFNSVSSLLNVVREFGTGRIKPYAGVGVGFTIQDGDFNANGNHYRLDDWRLAYQGILGLNVVSTSSTDFFCEYKYLGNTDSGIEDTAGNRFDEFAYLSESVVFGIRIKR